MYIEKLNSNKGTFHDLVLKPNCINIILGSKSSENGKKADTVNGVGKTLSIKLIDYCLGCRSDSHKEISKLQGWDFALTFNTSEKSHQIIRSVNNDKNVLLDGKKITLSKFKEFLEAECYPNAENFPYVSFRGLISRNLRIPKEAYLYWYKYKKGEDEHISLLLNAYLLGMDISLILKKMKIKDEINKIDKSKNLFSNDTEIRNAMSGSDVRIEINNLEKEITELKNKLDQFQISEGYNEIKSNIEKHTSDKNDIINQIAKYKNIVKSIDNNLKLKVDIGFSKVEEIYKEANVIFPDDMLKNLKEVCDFHEKLLDGRKARLVKDKKYYLKEITSLIDKLEEMDQVINKDMDFIKNKVSTTEYEKLQERLTELRVTLAKMKQYNTVIKELELKKANLQSDLAKDNIEALAYVESLGGLKKELNDVFSSYVDYIYGERKYSGIDIENNAGDNKIRYDIKVEIQDDGSGGIGNVKIFCMDMLLWEKGSSNVKFLYHDGSLFAETDPRQCYRMLKIASQIAISKNKQYIININYDLFDNIIEAAKNADDKDFASLLTTSVRLRLYDESPKDKLLGVQIK